MSFKETNKKIEEAVVGSYKKVEEAVVGGYQKIEDKFVDKFIKGEDETTEEAKERIKANQEKLAEENTNRVSASIKTTEEIQKEIHDKYGV